MVKISNASYENEIQRLDSTFNEDSKNILFFAMEALTSGEGWWEKVRSIPIGNIGTLLPGIKIFALLWFSCMSDQIIC